MDHLHPYILIIALASTVALYFLCSVVTSIYQGFMDFSRRFRGVE